jgi:aminoglycoside phosphotransferase (APT) family kinase protein
MRAALAGWLRREWGAEAVEVLDLAPLAGGAIQENRALRVDVTGGPLAGRRDLVLRLDAPSTLPVSHDRAAEFALLRAARAAGVTVPEAFALCTDRAVIGRPFVVMARASGSADPRALTAAAPVQGLAAAWGAELARLHRITPPRPDLAFLGPPPRDAALARIAELRALLDRLGAARPALEWGLAALARSLPAPVPPVLCHRDFRSGNVMVDAGRVSAVLDWEFATWSDPAEDLGWVTAPCWRFRRPDLDCGGIGTLEDLLAGYGDLGGTPPGAARLAWWQAMATARWAVIALWQAERHRSGAEHNLELALTGHLVPELELELLMQTAEGQCP